MAPEVSPDRNALAGEVPERALTIKMPNIDATNPIDAKINGNAIMSLLFNVYAIAIEAIIAPQ